MIHSFTSRQHRCTEGLLLRAVPIFINYHEVVLYVVTHHTFHTKHTILFEPFPTNIITEGSVEVAIA